MHRAFSMFPDHIAVGHRPTLQFLVVLLFCCASVRAENNETDIPTVGIEGAVVVRLPAGNLQAAALEDKPRLILRIAGATPGEDGGATYDLRYIGLAPGTYNLADFLVAATGDSKTQLPAIPVAIRTILPEDHKGELVSGHLQKIKLPGGYTRFFIGVWVCWALLLIPLIFVGRPRKEAVVLERPVYQPTLADLLRPLVQQALEGRMTLADKSRLERLLLNYWCTRLKLGREPMFETLELLKQHPQAGDLLRHLEQWLHEPPGRHKVDLNSVLAPYQQIAADDPAVTGGQPG